MQGDDVSHAPSSQALSPDDRAFLVAEYARLWNDFGLDDVTARPDRARPQHAVPVRAGLAPKPARPSDLPPRRPTPVVSARKAPEGPAPETKSPRPPPAPVPDAGGTASAPVPATLEGVREWLGDCRRCGLCEGRHALLFGDGRARAKVLFVGESPTAEEDAQAASLVGPTGELLRRIVEAMGLRPEDVYFTTIVKCRTPNNRVPSADEVAACLPFLKAQIDAVGPRLVVALGSTAATALTGNVTSMSSLRGRFHPLAWKSELSVMPTFHPAYLLRNPAAKKLVWDDMKQVIARLERQA